MLTDTILRWVIEYGYIGIFSLLTLGIIGAPHTGRRGASIRGCYLVYKGQLQLVLTMAAAFLGSFCGITLIYGLGRTIGNYLILFLVGGLPNSGYHSYGYAPWGLAGAALITPNLPALASIDQNRQAGAALGMRNSANSLGQTAGPALGGLLFCVGHEGGLFANGGDSGRRRDHHRLEGEGLQL